MQSNFHRSTTVLDGLPKQFVSAMRTLFDVMDDKNTGFVRFCDIESRWQDGLAKGLPRGVIESLRKVTPANGQLSFERFCAGLKICLLRHKATTPSEQKTTNFYVAEPPKSGFHRGGNAVTRPSSVPLPDIPKVKMQIASAVLRPSSASDRLTDTTSSRTTIGHVNTATVRPTQQRAVSMPLLQTNRTAPPPFRHMREVSRSEIRIADEPRPPPPPPQWKSDVHQPPPPVVSRRSGILAALENWRREMMNNEDGRMLRAEKVSTVDGENMGNYQNDYVLQKRTLVRSKSSSAVMADEVHLPSQQDGDVNFKSHETGPSARRAQSRRREPRRHTLANGIDYRCLKRMKQLEQERDVLLQGLEVVDRTREWYSTRIGAIQEKMQYIGKSNYNSEYASDVYQERLNLQMARIFEVNQHLNALMEMSEKGLPLHMNLAVRQSTIYGKLQHDSNHTTAIVRLKEQNRMLTDEVSKKSERITQLEKEKSALIRELFQSRSVGHRESTDTTFM